ncbi:hypothetical protein [[Mycobacterium] crassicus]|uniref:PE-PGRS family protein n=1 Tax=[Mycobacterium] crassicus TaxID=2872309 RepID=A0ABU5XMY2_9MYCO|nr:hypothetical protein [Mycolicibacter sp. MYC098]MEB3023569.1 hypothetical protein [Mycolicibacter sp. MYC098]
MALDAPLNARQLEVLRWIHDGCPDGRWIDFTFKTTANALASRRLVTVSKRGGQWSAAILPAGEHYLTNDTYPQGHWVKRRHTVRVELDTLTRPAAIAHRPVAATPPGATARPKRQPPADGLTPTRKLVKDIVDAGGILEVNTKDDDTSYRSLVGIINRRGMAPDGQEVLMVRGKTYHHVVFRLSSVSDWQTTPPAETMSIERIGRWHPAVAKLREDKRLDSIGKDLRGRAFRLLHALAKEAEARGHSVRAPTRDRHGYRQDNSKLSGDLIITVGDIECSVNIWQPNDRVDHVPTREEIEHEKKYGWGSRSYDYVPSNRLSIAVDTTSRFSSKLSWTETKTISLATRLPDVIMTFDRWAVIDAEGKEAERRAEIEKREREAREDSLARDAYVQHALGQKLTEDLGDWELANRLRAYLAALRDRVTTMEPSDERTAAEEWLHWCDHYVAQLDPVARPIRQPKVKPPDYNDLREFRQRLGFGMRW